jgi:hypothetical protein
MVTRRRAIVAAVGGVSGLGVLGAVVSQISIGGSSKGTVTYCRLHPNDRPELETVYIGPRTSAGKEMAEMVFGVTEDSPVSLIELIAGDQRIRKTVDEAKKYRFEFNRTKDIRVKFYDDSGEVLDRAFFSTACKEGEQPEVNTTAV